MNVQEAIQTYNAQLDVLLDHEGQYVILHGGNQHVGFWDTYEEALKTGYDRFGSSPFFVKKIERKESTHYFTRGIISGTIDGEDHLSGDRD